MIEKDQLVEHLKRLLDTHALSWDELLLRLSGLPQDHFQYWHHFFDVGSVINTVDVVPLIQRLCYAKKPTEIVRLLDVGAGTCGGTALLTSIFSPYGPSTLKLDVTALDLSDQHLADYVRYRHPHVKLIFEDLFVHDQTYELVYSSNVVEHIPDPVPFVRRMQQVATEYVIVTTPFVEETLIPGHCNRIDMRFIEQFDPLEVQTYTNVGWRPHGQVVTFVLRGRAAAADVSER